MAADAELAIMFVLFVMYGLTFDFLLRDALANGF